MVSEHSFYSLKRQQGSESGSLSSIGWRKRAHIAVQLERRPSTWRALYANLMQMSCFSLFLIKHTAVSPVQQIEIIIISLDGLHWPTAQARKGYGLKDMDRKRWKGREMKREVSPNCSKASKVETWSSPNHSKRDSLKIVRVKAAFMRAP